MAKKSDSILELNLMAQTKNELQEAAEFFGVLVRPSDRKAVMVEKLLTALRTDTLRCLECLPVYELRNLQLLISQGKGNDMLIPEPLPPLFTYMFGLLEECYDEDDYEDGYGALFQLYLDDEVFDLFAPHIDTAIKDVEQSGRGEFERFLWGCLTIYGYLSINEFVNLWRGFYPDRKQEEIFRFIESYSPFPYLTDGMGKHIMYPDMDTIDLIAEQRGRGTYEGPLAKVPLEDIISAGKTTPYNFPYVSHTEGRALADALKAVGHGGDAGAIRMHWLWREIEMGGGDEQAFQDLVQRILKDVRVVSIEKTRTLGRAIEDYCNALPVWGTRGLSSIESMLGERIARGNDAMSAFVRERMSGLMKDSVFHKVDRNDPCPCGSGRKYKDCHGKNQN